MDVRGLNEIIIRILVMILDVLLLIFFCFNRVKSLLLFVLSFVCLVFFAGFRAETIGTDTVNYKVQLDLVSNDVNLAIEPLWFLLMKMTNLLGGNISMLLVFSAILTLVPLFYLFRKQSPYPFLSLFLYLSLYYYFYSFNITRQCIALSFGLLAITFYNDKKYKSFTFWLIIATLFHYSAIIVLLSVLGITILKKLDNVNKYLLQIGTFFTGLFLYDYLFSFFVKNFYKNYENFSYLNFLGNFLNLLLLNVFFVVIDKIIDKKDNWYYFFYIYILTSNILVRIPFGNRFTMYFGITLVLFFPNLLTNNRIDIKQKSFLFFIITFYACLSYFQLRGNGEIYPYINIFFE